MTYKIKFKDINKYLIPLLFIILAISFVIRLNNDSTTEKEPTKVIEANGSDAKYENYKNVITSKYPEFKDFENQPSFAGRSVKFEEMTGGKVYVAYIENGSGLPIVKATCFKIADDVISQVGTFPDPTDSFAGYSNIDATTCKGIK